MKYGDFLVTMDKSEQQSFTGIFLDIECKYLFLWDLIFYLFIIWKFKLFYLEKWGFVLKIKICLYFEGFIIDGDEKIWLKNDK